MRPIGLLGTASCLALLVACDSSPPAAPPTCREDRDCKSDQLCIADVCVSQEEGELLDAGVLFDAAAFDAITRDATPIDAELGDGTPIDALPIDATPTDSGFIPVLTDAGPLDATPSDTGVVADATTVDATIIDATIPDAAIADATLPDATIPDSGPAGPVARGGYDYRRILNAGIPATTELVAVAISSDDRTALFGARYDRVYVFDIAADSSTVSVTLPKDTNEPVRINAIAYGPGYALIATTALIGPSNTPEGRLYRVGPRGQGPTIAGARVPGEWLEAIAVDDRSGEIWTLSRRELGGGYSATIRRYDDSLGTHTFVASTPVSAGCQDLAIADDGLGGSGLTIACGVNGAAVGVYDSTGSFAFGLNPGNTARVAHHPQHDYALAISWSGGRLTRFEGGLWTTGPAAPTVGTSAWNIAFSDDGARALITGQYSGTAAAIIEYRHDLYNTAELTDVSILNFNLGPWLGVSGVNLHEAAFRPGCDGGFIVGGCTTAGCARGYLIGFEVTNGRPCP
jgi:hypothetical protein